MDPHSWGQPHALDGRTATIEQQRGKADPKVRLDSAEQEYSYPSCAFAEASMRSSRAAEVASLEAMHSGCGFRVEA